MMETSIRLLRTQKEITQDDLAKMIGVRRETISRLEKGKFNPSLILAKKISIVLGESIESIFMFDKKEVLIKKII